MTLLPCLRDLNPIVNMCSIIIQHTCLLEDIIYSSKDKLWNALADAVNDISMETTMKLTSSIDNRLLLVPQNKGRDTSKPKPVQTIENSLLKT